MPARTGGYSLCRRPAVGQCAGDGGEYTVHYPASWFTVDRGPVPCRFFDPEPSLLPESTEATGLAIQVQLAPAPFDAIAPPLHNAGRFEETLSRRGGDLTGHRAVRIESRTRPTGILPAGTRRLTWYVEVGEKTLVATTSANALAGSFARNADVLDDIVAAVQFRPNPLTLPKLGEAGDRAVVAA